ncbi:MAG: hypothetical protein N2235_05260 [Fischerella sp.]|nr:hypothetical protein [Fischerella sp.]
MWCRRSIIERANSSSTTGCWAIVALWLYSSMQPSSGLGVIRYCKIRSKFRVEITVAVIAIAVLGKGLLPIAVIGFVAFTCVIQVVQDLYQSRPTTRLVDPGI